MQDDINLKYPRSLFEYRGHKRKHLVVLKTKNLVFQNCCEGDYSNFTSWFSKCTNKKKWRLWELCLLLQLQIEGPTQKFLIRCTFLEPLASSFIRGKDTYRTRIEFTRFFGIVTLNPCSKYPRNYTSPLPSSQWYWFHNSKRSVTVLSPSLTPKTH